MFTLHFPSITTKIACLKVGLRSPARERNRGRVSRPRAKPHYHPLDKGREFFSSLAPSKSLWMLSKMLDTLLDISIKNSKYFRYPYPTEANKPFAHFQISPLQTVPEDELDTDLVHMSSISFSLEQKT